MSDSPASSQERQLAPPEPSALLTAYEQAQHRIVMLEEQNAALRQEIRWIDTLLAVPASVMSPSQKVTLRAATRALQRGSPKNNGLIQIESWQLCKTVGQSKDRFLANLTYLSENVGALRKQTHRVVTEDGNYTTNLYIGSTDLLSSPERFQTKQRRNHGGERLRCPHCQSERLRKKVTITCMCCGAVVDEKSRDLNPAEPEGPALSDTTALPTRHDASADQTPFFAPVESNLTTERIREEEQQVAIAAHHEPSASIGEEPEASSTPPALVRQTPIVQESQTLLPAPGEHTPAVSYDLEHLMQEAATLLVEIAGPESVHVEMSSRGAGKYYEVKRALSLADARAHLAGQRTKGAMLRHPGGLTRAICYDADIDDDWLLLRSAAHALTEAGYLPLMEDSPAGRGGHLWIIFTDLVDLRCAHRHVRDLAPIVQTIKEYWPGAGNHKVRLPGGRYVKPGFSQQCKLYDAIGGLLAETRQEAARALLLYQTQAIIVPVYPPDPEPEPPQSTSKRKTNKDTSDVSLRDDQAHIDARWQRQSENHGDKHFWFQFTPQQLAAWYNERHPIEALLPPERNGMGLAGWRGERTASVGYTKDGEGWVDFGASARRGDGTQDGGDALELVSRISGQEKAAIMRQAARELVAEARASLESAAQQGVAPPAWVQEILTSAGKAHYQTLLLQSAIIPTQEALSVAEVPSPTVLFTLESPVQETECAGSDALYDAPGVSIGPYPPPARASYCCGSTMWRWEEDEERYVCGRCMGKDI